MATDTALQMYSEEDRTYVMAPVTAINITGWSLSFQIKVSPKKDATVVLEKTTLSGITITDAVNGEFSVAIASVDTASISPGTYWWEVARTDTGSRVVIGKGRFTIDDHVINFE